MAYANQTYQSLGFDGLRVEMNESKVSTSMYLPTLPTTNWNFRRASEQYPKTSRLQLVYRENASPSSSSSSLTPQSHLPRKANNEAVSVTMYGRRQDQAQDDAILRTAYDHPGTSESLRTIEPASLTAE